MVTEQPELRTAEPGVRRTVLLVDAAPNRVRKVGDLVGLAGCLLGLLLVLLLVVHGRDTTMAVTRDVQAAAVGAAPTLFKLPAAVLAALLMSFAPLAVLLELALRRMWRAAGTTLGALLVASVVGLSLDWWFATYASPELLAGMTLTVNDVAPSSVSADLAALVATLVAAGTASRSRVVRTSWTLLWIALGLAVIEGQAALTGSVFSLLVGYGVGLAMRYATGVYVDRSTGSDLVRAIRRAGADAAQVVRVDAMPRGAVVQASRVTTTAPVGYVESAPPEPGSAPQARAPTVAPARVPGRLGASAASYPADSSLADSSLADSSLAASGLADSGPADSSLAGAQARTRFSGAHAAALPADGHTEILRNVDVDALLAASRPAQERAAGLERLYRRYVTTDDAGTARDVVVLDADRQVLGLLQAIWDRLRKRGGARRPVSSVDEAADRAALLSLQARDAGVRTPALHGVARSRDSAVLVFEAVPDARGIGDLEPADLTDDVLDDLWYQLEAAHRHGLAHLDLSAGSILVDADRKVWLTGWYEGQIGSPDLSRRIDLAQVLALLATIVGPQPALASATRCLSPAQLAVLAPLLQPPALPRATRKAADNIKGLLSGLRESLVALVPEADAEPVQLNRFSARAVLTATVLVVMVWTLLTSMNFEEISGAVRGASLWWILIAFAVQLLSYWGGAVTLAAYCPDRIGVWKATEVHLASNAIDLVAPAAIGSATINLRFLNRSGVSMPVGIATVALVQISQFVTTVVLLVVVALGTGFAFPATRPSRGVLIAVAVAVIFIAGAFAVPRVRGWVWAKLEPSFEQAWPRLTWVFANPKRMTAGVVGNLVMTFSYVGAFAAAMAAFGETLPVTTLAITYLASNSAGSVIPTPGGIGPVEAALTGGLTVAGISPAVALSIALVYRLVTFWVNIPIGWLYLRRLQRQNLL